MKVKDRKLNATDHLRAHWRHWRECFEKKADRARLLLDLGTIRSIYWQALGQGILPVARAISAWWRKTAKLHQLGNTVI
ncbi:hypothetical protein [Oceanimonas smirnovii]|uniref:hypothetical protein n=1 Tax=Oceanimonas smirnovii TaxID=264574 RepID=UPI00037AA9CA|nr:hypothetical protein [Oceanimonas smirnovii]